MLKKTRSVLGLIALTATLACSTTLLSTSRSESSQSPSNPAELEANTRKIIDEVLKHGEAYSNLKSLVASGPRLCGSSGAAHAVEWAKAKLESYGFDRVWLQPVTVPVWTRGSRQTAAATVATSGPAQPQTQIPLRIVALGGSGGTPTGGIEAPVVEVHSLDEVKKLGSAVRGKIVFYNRPMDPTLADTFEAYSRAVDQRTSGPNTASRLGAVATLVRTMTNLPDDPHPHTGITHFRDGVKSIPAAAISTHDANVLSELIASGGTVRVRIDLSAESHAPTQSFNVIGEIKGIAKAHEIVDVGGHLDSWDLSPGAHDDGSGVVQSIEALRAIKAVGLHPARTMRVVLFMCEEVGGVGADEYARQAKILGEKHIVATESDRGGFRPTGFAVEDPTGRALPRMKEWAHYLAPLHAELVTQDESGTDVEPLVDAGAATFGLLDDSTHYFDVHHSEMDQLEAVDAGDLSAGAAALGVLTYLAATQGL